VQVQDLKYATLATVSRCGMVWFSEDVLSTEMVFENFLCRLRHIPLDEGEDDFQRKSDKDEDMSPSLKVSICVHTIVFL
jgi:dynein heavy chain 1